MLPDKIEKRGTRAAVFERATVDTEARTAELAFSSEAPVERWWGVEILGHSAGEVDDAWIGGGTAPLLLDHDPCEIVGVIENVTLGADRKMRATVRFGRSAEATEVMQDVADGIRANVSVGYELLELRLESEAKGQPPVYRAIRWRPLEVSLVSIPADMTVGVGRDAPETVPLPLPAQPKDSRHMDQNPAPAPVPQPPSDDVIRAAAAKHISEILALGELANARDQANEAIKRGITVEAFRGELLLARQNQPKPLGAVPSEVGLSEKETRQFSLARYILAQAERNPALAPLEWEASEQAGKQLTASGFQVKNGRALPFEIMSAPIPGLRMKDGRLMAGQRDLSSVSAGVFDGTTSGGKLTATDFYDTSFIDLLRAAMMVRAMGATVLSGLVGNVAIPRQTGAATAGWVAQAAAASESDATYSQVTMFARTVHAIQDFTRELLLQTTPDIEALVRADLAAVIGIAIDAAALHGTGSSGQPTGLAATAGIGSVAGGTNGAVPTWDNIVDLETQVANSNAAVGALGYLTNSKMRGRLKRAPIISGQPVYIWGGMPGMAAQGVATAPGARMSVMNEYPAGVSNNVSSTLTKGTSSGVCSAIFFGNWRDLLIGEWGGLETLTDNVTQAANRIIRCHAYQTVDVAVRQAGSFAAMLDGLTT